MLRFRTLLRDALREALSTGDLSADEQTAVRKVLRTRGALARFAVTITSIRGFSRTETRVKRSKSDQPWRDWIRRNWVKILIALVAFALSLI